MVTKESVQKAIAFFKEEQRAGTRKGMTKHGSNTFGETAYQLELTLKHGPCSYGGADTCPALLIQMMQGRAMVNCVWLADPASKWQAGDLPYGDKPPTACATRVAHQQ